ncbi:MAG: hypothetical protein U9R36_03815 [Elusimicrobiota bacterium]|nr:hypothetical protein [Elusimicrobiota bacterium]
MNSKENTVNSAKGRSAGDITHHYLTPLALVMVLLAVIFSQPRGDILIFSFILIFLSLIFNLAIDMDIKILAFLKPARRAANIYINAMLVYYLGQYWAPMWCLLLLTPISVAVNSSRRKTFLTSLLMSFLLMLIYFLRGVDSAVFWGQALSQAAVIIFISLFINALVDRLS